ncbi:MAG TPA: metallopeptidase family protein [Solirubrobacteraceae bacterium]|nr:metallopeptidase family protein [Solirubrobacteraceae bacterium]
MGLLIRLRETLALAPRAVTAADPPQPDLAHRGDEAFAELVRQALDELPDEFLQTLANTAVLVAEGGDAVGAYGLYQGPRGASADAPAHIVLFRDTLARDFGHDPRLLAEQVRRTVRHELAHHLGYDEPGVVALGL